MYEYKNINILSNLCVPGCNPVDCTPRVDGWHTWIARAGLTRSQVERISASCTLHSRCYLRFAESTHTPYIVNSHTLVPPFSPAVFGRPRAYTQNSSIRAATVNSRRIIPTRNLRIRETATAPATSEISVEGHRGRILNAV